ncbi:MAG: alpha/beta hydrolase [Clostridia bacterium]|nr:alpha/beta hydrolase [Clostridia bacterium]
MKKKLKIIGIGVIVILVLAPFISGDLEKESLNSETRGELSGSFIELSDGLTHYELKGDSEAKTIVLVHGNAAPHFTWDNNIDALVDKGFRVLRYDIYGHGYSDRPELETYNRDLYDRQLSELLEKLEIEDAIYLIGTSQGGSISAYFTAQHEGKVEKIAFLAPMFDTFEGKIMYSVIGSKGIGDYLMSVVGDKMLINPSRVLYSDEKKEELTEKLMMQANFKGKKRAVLANMRGDSLEDATPYYEQVKQQNIPVLLTWGENDKSISKESMENLCDLIPQTQYHLIKDASHLAHYEFSEAINPILIDFFKN